MRHMNEIAVFLLAAAIPTMAQAATISGEDYAVQYDYSEFYAATYNKNFRVILAGNPFPELAAGDVARRLLPIMQANKPRAALTFTYDKPSEEQHPDYRMVLVFDTALDLNADPVCRGVTRFRNGTPGRVSVYAVYCRNDQAMSQAMGRTSASGPDDPQVAQLFKELFSVLFDYSYKTRPNVGRGPIR